MYQRVPASKQPITCLCAARSNGNSAIRDWSQLVVSNQDGDKPMNPAVRLTSRCSKVAGLILHQARKKTFFSNVDAIREQSSHVRQATARHAELRKGGVQESGHGQQCFRISPRSACCPSLTRCDDGVCRKLVLMLTTAGGQGTHFDFVSWARASQTAGPQRVAETASQRPSSCCRNHCRGTQSGGRPRVQRTLIRRKKEAPCRPRTRNGSAINRPNKRVPKP